MKNRKLHWLLTISTLSLFILNFTPVLAQIMEVEVIGGGYRLKGPDTISLPSVKASFADQSTTKNIRDITDSSGAHAGNFIEVTDENGGNEFQVSVNATDLTSQTNGQTYTISKENFMIKHGDGQKPDVETLQGSANDVSLNSQTNDYTPFGNSPLTLLNGEGKSPGQWRIFPSLKATIPAATHPGIYQSVVTFTIN